MQNAGVLEVMNIEGKRISDTVSPLEVFQTINANAGRLVAVNINGPFFFFFLSNVVPQF